MAVGGGAVGGTVGVVVGCASSCCCCTWAVTVAGMSGVGWGGGACWQAVVTPIRIMRTAKTTNRSRRNRDIGTPFEAQDYGYLPRTPQAWVSPTKGARRRVQCDLHPGIGIPYLFAGSVAA